MPDRFYRIHHELPLLAGKGDETGTQAREASSFLKDQVLQKQVYPH